jgi:hypothetical protein
MFEKTLTTAILVMLVLLLVGCANAATPEPPLTMPPAATETTAPRTVVPVTATPPPLPTDPVATLPLRCRVQGQMGYADPNDKYCLSFPPRFKPRSLAPGRVDISTAPPEQSVEPVFAILTIEVKSIKPGTTLKQAVDGFVDEQPKAKPAIGRQVITLGSQPAERLENVPGRLAARYILLVHGDKLYTLSVQPLGNSKAQPDVDALYNAVNASFSFLPDLAWSEAVSLILEGKVKSVFQTHSLDVTLTLTDGRSLTTIEPQIDAVIAIIKQCNKCANLSFATE